MDKLTQKFIDAIDKSVSWKVLKEMASKGANVNERLSDGRSILQYAIDKDVYW